MRPASVPRRYWDPSAFLAWLEDGVQAEACRQVLEGAQLGQLFLVTSCLTLSQVVSESSSRPLDSHRRELLSQFFLNPYIILRPLDRETAEEAAQLMNSLSGLALTSAVHLATALKGSLTVFETFDPDLLRLTGSVGDPALLIRRPSPSRQLSLFR